MLLARLYKHCDEYGKDEIIKSYLPLVKQIARSLSDSMPSEIESSEMIAAGMVGLANALDRYDVEQNEAFPAFVKRSIATAICSSCSATNKDKFLKVQLEHIYKTAETLRNDLRRIPSNKEIAKASGYTTDEVDHLLQRCREDLPEFISVESAQDAVEQADNDDYERTRTHLYEWLGLSSPARETPDFFLLHHEISSIIARALDRLPENEAICLSLYFFGEQSLSDIGEALGVSDSRVCQIRKRGLERLRDQMGLVEHLRGFVQEM